jgi:hypothetical protein
MTFSPRLLASTLSVLLALTLVLSGCDSGSSGDEGLIAPTTPEVSFRVQPDSSQTDTVVVRYTGLSERPQPDTASFPSYYSVEVGEESGSPEDGESIFLVTFNGPTESGSYNVPVRFRSGRTVATVRFAGIVIGPQLITDFESGPDGFISFGGPGISGEDGQLLVGGTNVGGPGVFPGIARPFSSPTDFTATPVVEARIKVTADSDGPAVLRVALNGAGENADANSSVPELVAEVPADGEYRRYYFTFRDNFVQFDGVPVDPSQIGEIVFLLNDAGGLGVVNSTDSFTGTIYIDEILRRPAVPEDASASVIGR